MKQIEVTYKGNMCGEAKRGQSPIVLAFDGAPESYANDTKYSPMDMLVSSLGACMLSMMGFMAAKRGFSIDGATVALDYTQDELTHTIASISAVFRFQGLSFGDDEKKILQGAAKACPVGASLNKDIKKDLVFEF